MRQRLYSRLLDIDVFPDCVGTAEDALAKLDEVEYNLIIADVAMAPRGVEQIVERVAAMRPEKRPIVLVVAPTAEAARSLDVEIVQIVLRRPVNEAQIVELISSCVRSSNAPRRDRNVKAGGAEDGDGAVPN